MRRWGYGINSLQNKASIYIDEGPRWAFVLDDIAEAICGIVPSIPFPKAKLKLKDPDDIEFYGGQWTTWKEWYGDFNQYFHLLAHNPIFEFCQSKIRTKSVDITYDQAREMFYERDQKFFDCEAERVKRYNDSASLQ